jgi:hypothetical protein
MQERWKRLPSVPETLTDSGDSSDEDDGIELMVDSDCAADTRGRRRQLPLLRLLCVLLLKERLAVGPSEDVRSNLLPRVRAALRKVCVRSLPVYCQNRCQSKSIHQA